MKQRFSKEFLEIGTYNVFKYDKKVNDTLMNQLSWLEELQRLFPEHAFTTLEGVQAAGKFGYYMNTLSAPAIDTHLVDDMIKLSLKIRDAETQYDTSEDNLDKYIYYVIEIAKTQPKMLSSLDLDEYESKLKTHVKEQKGKSTWYHGDYTIHNMMRGNGNNLVPIDPNHKYNDFWSSWLLDLSKMLQDVLYTHERRNLGDYMVQEIRKIVTESEWDLIKLLLISHYIRMFPYIEDEKILQEKLTTFNHIIMYAGVSRDVNFNNKLNKK